MISRLLRGLLAIGLIAFTPQTALADDWLRADTDNFIIYSNGNARQLEKFANSVERFDTILRLRFNRPKPEQPNRLTIYMLSSARSVARLLDQRHVAGIYSPSMEGSYAITNRVKTGHKLALTGQITLFHEYAHHFMYRNFSFAYPAWYTEGFAEYVSTVDFDKDGRWTLGAPAYHRAWSLATDSMPIETILFEGMDDLKRSEWSAFYSWSWLLVHMLSADESRAGQLNEYLTKFGTGTDPREAAEAFGDIDELGAQLKKYADKGRLTYGESVNPLPFEANVRIGQLDDVTSRLVELGLSRKVKKDLEETRAELRKLASAAPGNAAVQYELGLIERDMAELEDATDFSLAEAAADRALAIEPQHVRANVLKAQLMLERLAEAPDTEDADWKAARRYITIANRQDPEDPLPLIAYFESYAAENRMPPEIAFDAVAKAFNVIPESRQARMIYAFALAGKGEFDDAIKLVQILASDPHSSSTGKRAMAVIESMRQAKTDLLPLEMASLAKSAGRDEDDQK